LKGKKGTGHLSQPKRNKWREKDQQRGREKEERPAYKKTNGGRNEQKYQREESKV